MSRPGFRDRDPGIPGRDSLPFPSLLLPGIPGRNEVLINGTKMIRTLVVPVTSDIFSSNYVVFSTVPPGFVSRSRSSLNFPVSRDFPGSLPSHLRDIPNPENLSGAGRDTPLNSNIVFYVHPNFSLPQMYPTKQTVNFLTRPHQLL